MRADPGVQRAAIQNDVLKQEFTAQAVVSTNVGRVSFPGQVPTRAPNWEADEKDSSIYDFNTYAEGEEGVRLLIKNGFDGRDLWLVGKGREGGRRPLRSEGNGDWIKSQDRHGPFWDAVSGLANLFNHESAWKSGPCILMMHGNSVEASKAHNVLVEHTNELIEECLRFR
jgi:hypothetical protein